MAYSVLQTNHKNMPSGTGQPVTLAFPGGVTAGSLLVCGVNTDHSADGGVINTPTGGGTWTQIGTTQFDNSTNNQDCAWFYCQSATGGATTVSVSSPGTSLDGGCMVIAEISGVATASALDVWDTLRAFASTTLTTDAETSDNITPAGSGELILALIHDAQGNAPTFTQGTGFTLAVVEPGVAASTGAIGLEWKTGGAGLQNATWTINKNGDLYTVQIAAFLPLGGVVTSPAKPVVMSHEAQRRSTRW